jgi:RNA-directed DNA polymerase
MCRRSVNQPLQTLIASSTRRCGAGAPTSKPGVSSVAFSDLAKYTLDRFLRWAPRKHRRITLKTVRRRYCNGGW